LPYLDVIRNNSANPRFLDHLISGQLTGKSWSSRVVESMKSQTPSTKLQTNLKFQYQMTKTGLEF